MIWCIHILVEFSPYCRSILVLQFVLRIIMELWCFRLPICVMFQKIWATCEIGEYLLSTFDPKVNNNAVAPDPLIDERFYKIVPGIDNRSIKYLTANIETLLRERGSPELVSYIAVPSTVHCFWRFYCHCFCRFYCHCCCCWLYVLS